MARSAPWLLALGTIAAAAGLWTYRTTRVNAAPDHAQALVRTAWTAGRRLALRGDQEIVMGRDAREPVAVRAQVLQSADGQLRIEYVSGPLKGVKIWENGERTYRFNPGLKQLTVAHKRESPEDPELLLQNYVPRVTGEEPVAGRPTVVVELRPRAGRNGWKRVWVDPEKGAILASEENSGKRGVLYRTRFTRVEYLPPDREPAPSAFKPPATLLERYYVARPGDTSSRFEPEPLSQVIGFRIRVPRQLPHGYTFAGAYQTPCSCKQRHQAARLEYSDGLHTISLFQCDHPSCTRRDNCFAADDSAPMAVALRKDGVSYLAVGDASRRDLEAMVRSAADR